MDFSGIVRVYRGALVSWHSVEEIINYKHNNRYRVALNYNQNLWHSKLLGVMIYYV